MFLAPIAAFLTGLALGFLKGFRKPRFTRKGALALVLIMALPAFLLHQGEVEPAIFGILLIAFFVTYLSLQAGLLIGDRVARWRGRRAC